MRLELHLGGGRFSDEREVSRNLIKEVEELESRDVGLEAGVEVKLPPRKTGSIYVWGQEQNIEGTCFARVEDGTEVVDYW